MRHDELTFDYQILEGAVDGVNDTFSFYGDLDSHGILKKATLYLNGIRLEAGLGNDFIYAPADVPVFRLSSPPQPGDKLRADLVFKVSTEMPVMPVRQTTRRAGATDSFVVGSELEQISVPAVAGDIAIRTDEQKMYVLATNDPGRIGSWRLAPESGGQAPAQKRVTRRGRPQAVRMVNDWEEV